MEFLSNTDNIRNICILAHVDHGKTTIADSLIASNGIISQRLAGKMRYLDNRQDEQERGITMKSSSIALKYTDEIESKYLINLVDTPGHVDFCGEVSAAVRLCDGALIVIDVVEGICTQTKVALEQAWKEGIEPILVLNKIDRLILEQRLDETAAYLRLSQILEQVNAIVATLLTTEIFEGETDSNQSTRNDTVGTSESVVDNNTGVHVYDWASAIEDVDDSKYYFMPEKSNVIFVSAIDDWAFTIESFAQIISKRNKINLAALRKTLWGDFYIDMKQQRILKNAQAKSKTNLFVSMILENIWRIYVTVCIRRDKVTMEKICQALGTPLSQRDLNHTDSRYQIKLIMSKWLNLANNILSPVAKIVPSPMRLSSKRAERLLSFSMKRFHQLPQETRDLKASFMRCSMDEKEVKIACISKMVPFERKHLPENKRDIIRKPMRRDEVQKNVSEPQTENEKPKSDVMPDDAQDQTVFIAFARIFSGTLKRGDKLFVLGPRHDPSKITPDFITNLDENKKLDDLGLNEHVTIATLDSFYLFMGREIESIEYAPAGNIVGIRGLERHLVRTATISSTVYCSPFNDLHILATPILRVAIEPKNPLEMSTLTRGLKLLNQADPCVEVKLQDTGEHVIVATGEVHLQHCLKDLVERYTNNMELNVSQPIVPFRETIVLPPKIDMVNETIGDHNNAEMTRRKQQAPLKDGLVELMTPNRKCRIRIKASPLPETVLKCLTDSSSNLRTMAKVLTSGQKSTGNQFDYMSKFHQKCMDEFRVELKRCIDQTCDEDSDWRALFHDGFVDRIWSFGPKYSGCNILVASECLSIQYSQWLRLNNQCVRDPNDQSDLINFVDSFVSGFQLATQSGPLCEEPMMGVCFVILDWSITVPDKLNQVRDSPSSEPPATDGSNQADNTTLSRDSYGPMSGQIISTVKDCCRKAFQAQPQRLMSPMFSCDIRVSSDALGRMYAVLGRRHGRIVHGDMREGSQIFEIKAFLPVIESLDFVNEIRDQTSGMANPQLIFSHYDLIDLDPFWTPTTEEEYALYGEKADTENLARKYMNLVRRRKGLSIQEKIVEHGEKQRTIKRNK